MDQQFKTYPNNRILYKINGNNSITLRIQVMRGVTIDQSFQVQINKWEEHPLAHHFNTVEQFLSHLRRQNSYRVYAKEKKMRIVQERDPRLQARILGELKLQEIVLSDALSFQEIASVCQNRSIELSDSDIKFIFLSILKKLSLNKQDDLKEKPLIGQEEADNLFLQVDISDKIKETQEAIANLTKQIDQLKLWPVQFKNHSAKNKQSEKSVEVLQQSFSKVHEHGQTLKISNQMEQDMKKIFQNFAKVSSSILENVSALHKKMQIQQKNYAETSFHSKITDSYPNLDKQIKTKQVPKQIQHDEQIRSQLILIPAEQTKPEEEFLHL